jgi:hypothetical protein
MYYEVSKREKKIARACIDKGLNEQYKTSLKKARKLLQTGKVAKSIIAMLMVNFIKV